jgi:hypothetical protein
MPFLDGQWRVAHHLDEAAGLVQNRIPESEDMWVGVVDDDAIDMPPKQQGKRRPRAPCIGLNIDAPASIIELNEVAQNAR